MFLDNELGSESLGRLADKIRNMPKQADAAMALAINKTATFTARKSVDRIVGETTLKAGYVKQNLGVTGRASPDNLRAIITARARATLTGRFDHVETSDGVKLRVNRSGGYRTIKGGWVARNLRYSGGTGVATTFRVAIAAARAGLTRGMGATQRKVSKIAKLARLARTNERGLNGMYVHHSRSVNQLFTSVRDDVKPMVQRKLTDEFIKDFQRLSKR